MTTETTCDPTEVLSKLRSKSKQIVQMKRKMRKGKLGFDGLLNLQRVERERDALKNSLPPMRLVIDNTK